MGSIESSGSHSHRIAALAKAMTNNSSSGPHVGVPLFMQRATARIDIEFRVNPTSTFRETKLFCLNEIGPLLVAMGMDHVCLGLNDVRGDAEVAIFFLRVK
jgi:hypothetical protein